MNPNGPTAADRSAVEAFLYHEAALLDAGALDDWVELFTDDGVYWVPARTGAPDPARHVSIVYDDKPRLLVRVARLQSGKEYAQEPPSRTCRQVSNVAVLSTGEGDVDVEASAVLVVYETRPNTTTQTIPARATWRLARTDDGFRVRRKQVMLLELDRYYENLTFLL